MSFRNVGISHTYGDEYEIWTHWFSGPDRENDYKLALQQIRKNSNDWYYKDRGRKVVDIKETRSKTEIRIDVKLVSTERKKPKKPKWKRKK